MARSSARFPSGTSSSSLISLTPWQDTVHPNRTGQFQIKSRSESNSGRYLASMVAEESGSARKSIRAV
jgi:hypothetical protein